MNLPMSENCTHDCSSCGENCPSRQQPQSFLEKTNDLSHVKKVIGVVSGQGGVECADDAQAPEGWTKWKVPGYEYLCAEAEDEAVLSRVLDYMRANGLSLVGAVQDFTCPATGKDYMLFPIRVL